MNENDSKEKTPAAPQKFIRTYADDVAQASGKPPAEHALAPSPEEELLVRIDRDIREKPPSSPSTPTQTLAPLPEREAILARLKARAEGEAARAVIELPDSKIQIAGAPPSARPPEAPRMPPVVKRPTIDQSVPAILHTYKSDVAEEISRSHVSEVSAVAKEEDAARISRVSPEKPRSRGPFFALIAGAFLFIGGGVGVYVALTQNQNIPLMPNAPSSSLIFAEERESLPAVSGNELLKAIAASAETPVRGGNVRELALPEGFDAPAGPSGSALVNALGLSLPGVLARDILSNSMAGAVSADGITAPFFILKVSSYERSFAGMLEWEKFIVHDLALLYPVAKDAGVATSTSAILSGIFHDESVESYDVRILRDVSGKGQILYGYKDKGTLVIVRNEAAFSEILRRLTSTRGE